MDRTLQMYSTNSTKLHEGIKPSAKNHRLSPKVKDISAQTLAQIQVN